MMVIAAIVGSVLVIAGALTLFRIVKGPATLDRIIATDVLLAVIVASIAGGIALTQDGSALPLLVVVSILGFTGSVGVARFAGKEKKE